MLNNILIATATATVFVGTLYPLALEALTGQAISVGPPYFNLTFGPLMVPLLLALPFGPLLAWKRGDAAAAMERLLWAVGLTMVVAALTLAFTSRGPWLAPFALALGVWVIAGTVSDLAFRAKVGRAPWPEVLRRLRNLPRASFGGALAHAGVGVMVIGIVATSAWQSEKVVAMRPGEKLDIAGYTLDFRGTAPGAGPNYQELTGIFAVTRGGAPVTELTPSKRLYDQPRQPTTEAGIHASWRGDLYAVLGDEQQTGAYTVRVYFNPLVRLIWIGAVIMFFGGLLSLSDRRLRVGAPQRARPRGLQPAE